MGSDIDSNSNGVGGGQNRIVRGPAGIIYVPILFRGDNNENAINNNNNNNNNNNRQVSVDLAKPE